MAGAEKVVKSGLSSALSVFFEYDTPKIVHISSKTVGVINRLIQLVILAYLIGYVLSTSKSKSKSLRLRLSSVTACLGGSALALALRLILD